MGKREIGLEVFSEASSCRGDRGAEAGWMPGGEAAADQKSSFDDNPSSGLSATDLHPPPRMNDINSVRGLALCQNYKRHYIPCHSRRLILSH